MNLLLILEWSALAAAVMWTIGLGCIILGTRKARRSFRGKGYLRPPTGKAWLRFIYFKHYESFDNAMIRFYFRVSRVCLFAFCTLVMVLSIFLGSIYLLRSVNADRPDESQSN